LPKLQQSNKCPVFVLTVYNNKMYTESVLFQQ